MSQQSEHLYREMLGAMSGHGVIKTSLERQEIDVMAWIDNCLEDLGADQTGEVLLDFVEMDNSYQGTRPILNDLVDATNNLRQNGIDRDTASFRMEIESAGAENLFNTFDMRDNLAVPRENLGYQPEPEKPHPYREAFDIQKERYDEATRLGDTDTATSAARVLDRLLIEIDHYDKAANDPVQPQAKVEEPKADPRDNPDYEAGYVPDASDSAAELAQINRLLDGGEIEEGDQEYMDSLSADESTEEDQYGDEHFA